MTSIETLGLVLDLDDTLYLERDYVRSGFEVVGRHVGERFGITDFGQRCWSLFEQGVRGSTFDRVLDELGLSNSVETTELIDVYRRHAPTIGLCDDAQALLDLWPQDRPLGLITDGPVQSQRAKIKALQLQHRLEPIILSDTFGIEFRKPHDRSFAELERSLALRPHQLTYVADNPRKDFLAPRRRVWQTIRIRRELGEHCKRNNSSDCFADAEIANFGELTW